MCRPFSSSSLSCKKRFPNREFRTTLFMYTSTYNQLKKALPRSLQKIRIYKQPLKTSPNQSMSRVKLWKLMQHWLEGWVRGNLISVWIRFWQRYFVTDCRSHFRWNLYVLQYYRNFACFFTLSFIIDYLGFPS